MPIRTAGRASPLQGEGHWLIISKKNQLLPFYEGKECQSEQLGEHRPYKARVTG